MSWDIFIQDLPEGIESVADISEDFRPSALGCREELIAAILEVFPRADFRDPAWGVLDEADFSIEFNMGDRREVGSIVLHIRGGDSAAGAVERLLSHLGRRALDTGTGELFQGGSQSTKGIRRWRAYRDRIVEGD
ncbi:MAG: hypothetical protein WBM46_00190 [Polyangiales bacterium]